MKIKLQTMLKNKLHWLLLLVALLGVSQGMWGDTYPANKRFYVKYGSKVNNLKIHLWGGTSSTTWPGILLTYIGKIGNDHYYYGDFNSTFTNYKITEDGTGGSDQAVSGDGTHNLFTQSNGNISNFAPSGTEDCSVTEIRVKLKNPGGAYDQSCSWNSSGGAWIFAQNGSTNILGNWPGTYQSSQDGYYSYTFSNSESYSSINVTFRSDHDWGGRLGRTNVLTLSKGHSYEYEFTGACSEDGTWEGEKKVVILTTTKESDTEISLQKRLPVPILSNTSNPSVNNSSVTLYGYIASTGCDNISEYGFQYSTDKSNITTAKVEGSHAVGSYNLTINSLPAGEYYYRAYAKNSEGEFFSDWSLTTFEIVSTCTDAPNINPQPSNQEVCYGSAATLSLSASITEGTPTYQWFTCNSDGTSPSPIDNAENSSYTTSNSLSVGTHYYKCEVYGCERTSTSNVVSVTVDATSVAGTIGLDEGAANPICSGTSTTLKLNSSVGSIQWQHYNTSTSEWDNDGTDTTQGTGTLYGSRKYRAQVTSGVCSSKTTGEYTVTMKTAPADPSFNTAPTVLCAEASGSYTVNGTADSWAWTFSGGEITGSATTNTASNTLTAGSGDNQVTTVTVTARNCTAEGLTPIPSANSATVTVTQYMAASPGTVNLSDNNPCAGSVVTASPTGTWHTAGGSGAWSVESVSPSGAVTIDSSSGEISAVKVTSSAATVKYTIGSPACGGSVNATASINVKGVNEFTIGATPASGYTPWKPITLSTSNSANANWSISTDPSPGTAYLNASTGVSSTMFKAPANVSNYTVSATETSDGCDRTATKNITVSSVECE